MAYAELFCQSHYSFLTGASAPEELVQRAQELGYRALALTDECSLAGIVKAHQAAHRARLPLLCGSFFRLHDPEHPEQPVALVLLAPDRTAYAELSTFITRGRRRSAKGEYHLTLRDLDRLVRSCLLLWLPAENSDATRAQGAALQHGHGDRLWLGVTLHRDGEDQIRYLALHALAVQLDLPMTAAGAVLMHDAARKPLLDTVTAIRLNTPVAQLGSRLHGNAERHLRPVAELQTLYPAELLAESVRIAARCTFTMTELRYEYPKELVPAALTPAQYLRALTETGAAQRWPAGVPAAVRSQLEHELALIAELGYEYYFLTVHDIVAWARARQILCQGRGSAANSAVCFCLGITEVDPARSQLLFERFLSRERAEPPDIDVDFEHERREEVIQHIYRKYSREHAALAATLICYRRRSVERDLDKALAGDAALISRLQPELLGVPRHLSQHVGGFVITRAPITSLVPVENAAMPDRTIIQWDKDDLEAMGLLKVDILALGMLTAIRRMLELVNAPRVAAGAPALTMATIPAEDPATYDMLCRGDSVGVFQVESRAQMAMLPRLRPRTFYDLVIQVAIVRPGPIQGGMVHPYLRRRAGTEPVEYPGPAVQAVLERTLGVPIFQEQVIKLAMVAAGFSGGEADQLRRAMGAWRKTGELEQFRHKLIDGMLARGYPAAFAERLFRQIEGFGEYGFPESHAASFALLVYVSAWLKCHHPAAFCCALLNSQPMGFYSPSQLVQDARRHGVPVLPVDVDHSAVAWTLAPQHDGTVALRTGLCQIKGLGNAAARIVAARAAGPFTNLQDVQARAGLDKGELAALVAARALPALVAHRHQGHWEAQAIETAKPLTAATERNNPGYLADGIRLPAPSETADLIADYASTGLTLNRHPLAILRTQAPFCRCTRAAELAALNSGRFVRVAGVVTNRQRPGTASGVLFMTLEDETGTVNLVLWNNVQERFRDPVLHARLLLVKGTVEVQDSVVHVIAGELLDVSAALSGFAPASRDFH